MFIVLFDHNVTNSISIQVRLINRLHCFGFKFYSIEDARKFAVSEQIDHYSKDHIRSLRTADLKAQILDEKWTLLETYVNGSAVSESKTISSQRPTKNSETDDKTDKDAKTLRSRFTNFMDSYYSRPFILVVDLNGNSCEGHTSPIPLIAFRYDAIEKARKDAVWHTTPGLYNLNGQLNEKRADILDSEMRLLETYISGFPEAKYLELKAKK